MYRGASSALDEHDHAVGAILITETLVEQCERAARIKAGPERWRAIRDAHDDYAEIWRQLDRAQRELAGRGANTLGYEELRPHVRPSIAAPATRGDQALDPEALEDVRRALAELKLAIPGTDWKAIAKRSVELVDLPQLRRSHRGAVVAVVGGVMATLTMLILGAMPAPKKDAVQEMRREIAGIAQHRKLKLQVLSVAVGPSSTPHCRAETAHEYVKLLVMDGRGDDAETFADAYLGQCGEDTVVENWANAPRPR